MNFINFFSSDNLVLNLVFVSLVLMSMLSWYVIFYKGLKLKNEYQAYQNFIKKLNNNQSFNKGLASNQILDCKWPIDFFKDHSTIDPKHDNQSAIDYLITQTQHIKLSLDDQEKSLHKEIFSMHLIQILDRIRFNLDHGLTILASIGSCAPFVGLFGTVLGIYHALNNISSSGNAGLVSVAQPISEALIATAFGLFAAIPAVLAYNSFVRLNRLLVQNLRHLAEQITTYLN
jgi:biopolymer transport protein ExbB